MSKPVVPVPFLRTKAGKQIIAQSLMLVGVILSLPGAFLVNRPGVSENLLHLCTGLGLGLVLVGAIAIFVNRFGSK